jgi:hypothetical protein
MQDFKIDWKKPDASGSFGKVYFGTQGIMGMGGQVHTQKHKNSVVVSAVEGETWKLQKVFLFVVSGKHTWNASSYRQCFCVVDASVSAGGPHVGPPKSEFKNECLSQSVPAYHPGRRLPKNMFLHSMKYFQPFPPFFLHSMDSCM